MNIFPGLELIFGVSFFGGLTRSIFLTGGLTFFSMFNFGYSFLSFFCSGGGLTSIIGCGVDRSMFILGGYYLGGFYYYCYVGLNEGALYAVLVLLF